MLFITVLFSVELITTLFVNSPVASNCFWGVQMCSLKHGSNLCQLTMIFPRELIAYIDGTV